MLSLLIIGGVLATCAGMCAYNMWRARQPWPDFGGRITSVGSLTEWHSLLAAARGDGVRLVLIDAYALWCPPCRAAAPVFARMSEEYDPSTVIFAKVNVDDASDVARAHEIRAMPTFKVWRPREAAAGSDGDGLYAVETVQGWKGEAALRELLVKHGAVPGKAKGE